VEQMGFKSVMKQLCMWLWMVDIC